MAATDYKDLFKNDFKELKELKELKESILEFLEEEESQKKAALVITELMNNQKTPN